MKRFALRIKKASDKIAIGITHSMSSMWCVYAFLIWSLIPLVWHGAEAVVFYVSGGVIQLVALPMIMVGQSLLGKKAERRAEQDHQMIMQSLAEVREIDEKLARLVLHLAKDDLTPPQE